MKIALGELRRRIKEELSSERELSYSFIDGEEYDHDERDNVVSVRWPVVMVWERGGERYEFLGHVNYRWNYYDSLGLHRDGRWDVETDGGDEIVPGVRPPKLLGAGGGGAPEEFFDEGGEFDELTDGLREWAGTYESLEHVEGAMEVFLDEEGENREFTRDPGAYYGVSDRDFR